MLVFQLFGLIETIWKRKVRSVLGLDIHTWCTIRFANSSGYQPDDCSYMCTPLWPGNPGYYCLLTTLRLQNQKIKSPVLARRSVVSPSAISLEPANYLDHGSDSGDPLKASQKDGLGRILWLRL